MLVLQVALGNVPRGVWLDPRLLYNCTVPRFGVELPTRHQAPKTCEAVLKSHYDVVRARLYVATGTGFVIAHDQIAQSIGGSRIPQPIDDAQVRPSDDHFVCCIIEL